MPLHQPPPIASLPKKCLGEKENKKEMDLLVSQFFLSWCWVPLFYGGKQLRHMFVCMQKLIFLCVLCHKEVLDLAIKILYSFNCFIYLHLLCSRLPLSLVVEVMDLGCDLVVIEGMGRALHTNLNVELTCDVLKLAVIKNKWLAER